MSAMNLFKWTSPISFHKSSAYGSLPDRMGQDSQTVDLGSHKVIYCVHGKPSGCCATVVNDSSKPIHHVCRYTQRDYNYRLVFYTDIYICVKKGPHTSLKRFTLLNSLFYTYFI
ncbi:uncharacterized protein LOC124361754 isoform X2 [Homalodisca vitripennis]|uniref:uncharacterized protein LOC124361754 isoform X2 n=1 Tax=Homalodisca vitripennis TaxID=197043 RepID=UPI001EEBCBFC|nr:uncharacterized protein LOC124361754 isoform X2 [Homalodisca vitripennis]